MTNLIPKSALGVLVVGICFVGLVFGVIVFSSAKGQSRMNNSEEVRIPPIDVSAPTETETATFALG
jgi:hypothetical protein